MKNIVIALNSFKGSKSSVDACRTLTTLLKKRVGSDVKIHSYPGADGGDGTLEVLCKALKARVARTKITGPLGNTINSYIGFTKDKEAIIELALASGLALLSRNEYDALRTTSYGTGQLIKRALDLGAKKIYVGVGGSATNDGGVGLVQALGGKFLDKHGRDVGFGGITLGNIETIDLSELDPRLEGTKIIALSDVANTFSGERGATETFGGQKGATKKEITLLESSMTRFSATINRQFGIDLNEIPGSGAAGGVSGALHAFLGAEIKSGSKAIMDIYNLEDKIKKADLIITGEGRYDASTVKGKLPYEVLQLSKKHEKKCYLICGDIDSTQTNTENSDFHEIYTVRQYATSLQDSIHNIDQYMDNIVKDMNL